MKEPAKDVNKMNMLPTTCKHVIHNKNDYIYLLLHVLEGDLLLQSIACLLDAMTSIAPSKERLAVIVCWIEVVVFPLLCHHMLALCPS